MATNDSLVATPSFGSPPPLPASAAKPAKVGDGLLAKLGAVLGRALEDASSLEVKTFTSDSADAALSPSGDPLTAHTRLRAFTRIALDGDTQICIPVKANGEADETLWKLHQEAVVHAREDRAKTIAAVIATLKDLHGSGK